MTLQDTLNDPSALFIMTRSSPSTIAVRAAITDVRVKIASRSDTALAKLRLLAACHLSG